MAISYINSTLLHTGSTTIISLGMPPTVLVDDTLMLILSCHDTGLTPTIDPSWYQILNIDGRIGSTFIYLHDHIASPLSQTDQIIGSVSNKLNCGFIMRFNGCTYHESILVNASVEIDNSSGNTGNDGFTTTKNNTIIIQVNNVFAIGDIGPITTSNWSSFPALSWTEVMDSGTTHESVDSVYTLQIGASVSSLAPTSTYRDFDYDLSDPTENISITIALTPRSGAPNNVLNLLKSF